MGRVVIELTNRCNLSCEHCFSGRHGGGDDLPLSILDKIIEEAKGNGFDRLSFTGGDPTVHPRFPDVLRLTHEGGYRFSFVTNGWNFATIYPRILPYREQLSAVTFSLDGATEQSHDKMRGKGSYRRVMKAFSICVAEDIPFTINTVLNAHNRHELEEIAQMATQLGSRGLRFGHLMPSLLTTIQNFDLPPWERKVAESEIWDLQQKYPIRILMAPGYHTTSLFPCAPLMMQEVNVDCHGNLTKCCHLSGHGEGAGQGDVIGYLGDISFTEAYQRLVQENEQFHELKIQHRNSGGFRDSDFFPCWYCTLHYKKVDWLKKFKDHSWLDLMWDAANDPAELPAASSGDEGVS